MPRFRATLATAPDNKAPEIEASQDDLNQRAADGFLINGSANKGAASPFAQLAAFGNNRNGTNGLYNGGIGIIFDNSALDARPFSLSGQNTPKAAYNRVTGVATLGGPLRIAHLFQKGPTFFIGYQWTRNRNDAIQSALMPDSAERDGNLSQGVNELGQPVQIFDPATGLPFPGNIIPQNRISPQTQALLNFYPLPNVAGNPLYNYQIPIISNTHQDARQSRLDKTLNPRNEVYGDFAFQSTRSGSPNLFGFLDVTDTLGINSIYWSHRFNQRFFLYLGYRFTRLATRITPYWENRENVSGQAGITGNNQDPMNFSYSIIGTPTDTQINASVTIASSAPNESVPVTVTSTGFNGSPFIGQSGQSNKGSANANVVRMFFALSNAMFDASIATWDAKRTYDSVRPITAIQFLFRGKKIRAWGGPGKGTVEMDGAQWIPYQQATFPTPPFPE